MSASRPNSQKVDLELEAIVEEKFCKIHRPISQTWEEYYTNLASSKILILSAVEDTFGYQIIDAILNGCIPIARNSLAYPEILSREYLYKDENELIAENGKRLFDGKYGGWTHVDKRIEYFDKLFEPYTMG